MKDIVTIIIPTYNNEKYICRCIESVLNQTYKNLDIVVVDDGSVDNTMNKIHKYIVNHQIKYIFKNNTGVSDSRNVGINNAIGEYIMFLDSDDYLPCDYIKNMLFLIKSSNSDMVFSGINYCGELHKKIEYYHNDMIFDFPSDSNNFFSVNLFNYSLFPVWNKIYKKSIVDRCNFDKSIKIGEDYIFNLMYLKRAKRVGYCHSNFYNYFFTGGNTTSSLKKYNKILTLKNEINYFNKTYALLKELNISNKYLFDYKKWAYSLSYLKIYKNYKLSKDDAKIFKKNIKELNSSELGLIARRNFKNIKVLLISNISKFLKV